VARIAHALVFVGLAASTPFAQSASAPPSVYAEEALVFDHISHRIAVDGDGTALRNSVVRVRVQSAAGVEQAGTVVLPYSKAFSTLDVKYLRVRKPTGAVIETPASSGIDLPADITRIAPTYTDLYLRQFNVVGLAAGDVLEYATEERTRSLIPPHFSFELNWNDEAIVLDQSLEISVPAELKLTVKSGAVQPTTADESRRRVYRWANANLARRSENELAVKRHAERDRRADVQVTTFRDWPQVGEAIRDLWRDRAAVTPAIRVKAQELTKGLATDQARLEAIYAFVALNIRYVSVSLGIGRYQPHAAEEVLANGFGDCKDKHTLLAALLGSIGIAAEPALIGPGLPFDRDIPTVAQFNHVVTIVPIGGSLTWLDTTLSVAPIGHLASVERNRDVLVLPERGNPHLDRTPAVSTRAEIHHVQTLGSVSVDGTLEANVEETFSGDLELVMRAAFRTVPQPEWVTLVSKLSIAERFNGSVSNVAVSPIEDTSRPFRLTYRYTDDQFSDWKEQKISPALPYLRRPTLAESDSPGIPIEIGGPVTLTATSRLELPSGFVLSLETGTEGEVIQDEPFARHRLRSQLRGRLYEVEREFELKRKELAVAEFDTYRRFDAAVSAVPSSVVLRPRKPWADGDQLQVDWYAGSSAAAVSTMKSAVSASNQRDYQKALALLEPLTTAEPTNASAWVLTAWVHRSAGRVDEAIAILMRQLTQSPSPDVHKLLASYLIISNRRTEAADVFSLGRERYPDDVPMLLYGGENLFRLSRHEEALSAFQAALGAESDSARLQMNIGLVHLAMGNTAAAVPSLLRSAALDPTPNRLNNVAWELAEANLAIDDAMTLAERAVKATEDEALALKFDALDTNALEVMRRLGMYWDTLGWAHYRKRNFDSALNYLVPAWELLGDAIVAQHIGELYEAQGNKTSAERYYALQREAASSAKSRDGNLERDRTISVSRPSSVPGGAIGLFLLVAPDHTVTDIRMVDADVTLKPAADVLRSKRIPGSLPQGSVVRTVRRGTLTCPSDGQDCRLVLEPANTVRSVN
jgi:tetratricopeptide (TPR) repeat protein